MQPSYMYSEVDYNIMWKIITVQGKPKGDLQLLYRHMDNTYMLRANSMIHVNL